MGRLKEIDGLRAVAILAVLVFHYRKDYLPFGYLGVDIFFSVSGYVITKTIVERLDSKKFSFNDFFLRRAKRLLPNLAAVTAATLIISPLLLPVRGVVTSAFPAFFGLSNIWFWYKESDYFAHSTEWNPFTHTWSLGVEEQFYLVFPFLLYFLFGNSKRLISTVAALALISLLSYLVFWANERVAVFYLSPFRFWELIAGSLVLLAHRSYGFAAPSKFNEIFKVILIGILALTLLSSNFQENYATVICVTCTCGILYLLGDNKTGGLLNNIVAQYIGRISYSLYLWH